MLILLIAGIAYVGTYVFAAILWMRGAGRAALALVVLALLLVPAPLVVAWAVSTTSLSSGTVEGLAMAGLAGLLVVPLLAPFVPLVVRQGEG
jgi:hypothetical protein